MPRAWSVAATARASSCSFAHGTTVRSWPLTNVTAAGRSSAARWRRLRIGRGVSTDQTWGAVAVVETSQAESRFQDHAWPPVDTADGRRRAQEPLLGGTGRRH